MFSTLSTTLLNFFLEIQINNGVDSNSCSLKFAVAEPTTTSHSESDSELAKSGTVTTAQTETLTQSPSSLPTLDVNLVFCFDIVHSSGAALANFLAALTFIDRWRGYTGCLNNQDSPGKLYGARTTSETQFDNESGTKSPNLRQNYLKCNIFVKLSAPFSSDADWGLWGVHNPDGYTYMNAAVKKKRTDKRFRDIVDIKHLQKRMGITIVEFDEDIEVPNINQDPFSSSTSNSKRKITCSRHETDVTIRAMHLDLSEKDHQKTFNPRHGHHETVWKAPVIDTMPPDHFLEHQNSLSLSEELDKFFTNSALVFFTWLSAVQQSKYNSFYARKMTSLMPPSLRQNKGAYGSFRGVNFRPREDGHGGFGGFEFETPFGPSSGSAASATLRMHFEDFISFNSKTNLHNNLLHLGPGLWLDESHNIASHLRFVAQKSPSIREATAEGNAGSRWYNATKVKMLSLQKDLKAKKNLKLSTAGVTESHESKKLLDQKLNDKNPNHKTHFLRPEELELGRDCAFVFLRRRLFIPDEVVGTLNHVRPLKFVKYERTENGTVVEGAEQSNAKDAASYLETALSNVTTNAVEQGYPEFQIIIPKFKNKQLKGLTKFTDEQLEPYKRSALKEAAVELNEDDTKSAGGHSGTKANPTPSSESVSAPPRGRSRSQKGMHRGSRRTTLATVTSMPPKSDKTTSSNSKKSNAESDPKSIRLFASSLERAYVSMTSCKNSHINTYANQGCIQYIPLRKWAAEVATIVRDSGLKCASLNLNLFRSSAFSDVRRYTEAEIRELEEFMLRVGEEDRLMKRAAITSKSKTGTATAVSKSLSKSITTTNTRNKAVSISSPAYKSSIVSFHIIRKPYGLGKKFESTINLSLMYLASISPLLISEKGTFWTDALLLKRLYTCGYGIDGIRAETGPEFAEHPSVLTRETNGPQRHDPLENPPSVTTHAARRCMPFVLLEGNTTSVSTPAFHCGVHRTLADWNRCYCGMIRGNCVPAQRIYRGFFH